MNESTSKKVLILCVVAVAMLFFSNVFLYSEIHQDDDRLDDIETAFGSVVEISATEGNISASGTGFITEHNGGILVVTCAHCIIVNENDPTNTYDIIVCKFYGSSEEYELRVVKYEPAIDLAALEFVDDVDVPALNIGDSDRLRPGQYVYTIGNAQGLGLSFSSGTVSSMVKMTISTNSVEVIMTNAPLNPGNSGGPLISKNNEVVGVIFSKMTQSGNTTVENMGFAMPSNILLEFLRTL